MGYTTVNKLSDDWASYKAQNNMNGKGAPTEKTIHLIKTTLGTDIVTSETKLHKKEPELLKRTLEPNSKAPDTVSVEEYEKMIKVEQPTF